MNEAAKIHTGGIYDFMAPNLPAGMTRQAAAAWIREDPQAADKVFRQKAGQDPVRRSPAPRHS